MKTYFITIIGLILALNVIGQEWIKRHVDSTKSVFYDIQFINNSEGYIVGGDPSIPSASMYYTDDGGMTWIDTNFSVYALWSIHFLGKDTGYVATNQANPSDLIFKTTDGGANWSAITTGIVGSGRVVFKDSRIGYHYSSSGADDVAYTTDGGDNWTMVSPGTFGLKGVQEIEYSENAPVAYAITSSGGNVYKTTDDTTWVAMTSPSSGDLTAINVHNDSTLYVSEMDKIWKSIDGGVSWTSHSSSAGGIDISNMGIAYCFLLNPDSVMSDFDCDGSSYQIDYFEDTSMTGLRRFSHGHQQGAWVVGDSGRAYEVKINVSITEIEQDKIIKVFPNPSSNGRFNIHFEEAMNNVIVSVYGMDGRLFIREFYGTVESNLSLSTSLPNGIYLIQIRNDNDVYSKKILIGQ